MQKYEAIEKGIEQGDVNGLREAIASICYTSRDFSSGEFDEAVRYVERKGIKIREDAVVGELISENKSVYTDEDFARAIFELRKNFCNERIDDVKKIGKSLYKRQPQRTNPVSGRSQTEAEGGTSPNVDSHQRGNGLLITVGILVAILVMVILMILL